MVYIGVLGATGFLGSAIYEHLSKNPLNKVEGFSRSSSSDLIYDFDNLDSLINYDYIINCAGPSYINCSSKPIDAYLFYDIYQNRLLDLCIQNNIKLITFSTIHVYDQNLSFIDEDSLVGDGTFYTKYRKNFEQRIRIQQSKNIVLLRLGNCFGLSHSKSKQEKTLFINSIADAYRRKQKFIVKNKENFSRHYVPLSYLKMIIEKLLTKNEFNSSIYNVVGDSFTTADSIIKMFYRLTKKEFVQYSFEKEGIHKKISNKLCNNLVPYKDCYFKNEIEKLLK